MLGIGKTISWIFLVVFFVALAAIATTFYESDKAEQERMRDNELLKKGQAAIDFATNLSSSLSARHTEDELVNNAGQFVDSVKNVFSEAAFLIEKTTPASSSPSSLSINNNQDIGQETLNDWLGDGANLLVEGKANFQSGAPVNLKDRITESKFWTYRKNGNGAEIILSSKEGREYIIPLPFKFLSEK